MDARIPASNNKEGGNESTFLACQARQNRPGQLFDCRPAVCKSVSITSPRFVHITGDDGAVG